MSGECDRCGEHCVDCNCRKKISMDLHLPSEISDIRLVTEEGYTTYNIEKGHVGIRMIESDQINNPSHYQGKRLEVIDIIEDFNLGFNLGNCVKYILRAGKKDKKEEDLRKAIWYLEREISKT